ncbi:zinc ribbon domain-containing protein [Mycolicibacterium parafortuitum]|uniref:zinc ribbon domain-containing protein n=2 Tax=Mycolicibacterium parafortuitum TaxID=39692 RepID=UPI001F29271A|nr:zinc ribbon domain-containing protein [Mycolicibacterium parafortuitum]
MHPMQSRPDEITCPTCQGRARRMIAAPNLGRSAGTAMALHDATRSTADTPGVVSAPPRKAPGRKVTTNPLHRKLPRP